MGKYCDMLTEDVRLREGLKACMNCGVCTAVCPAAEFYNYDPRQIVAIVEKFYYSDIALNILNT